MPPKAAKGSNAASKKAETKKKEKVIEDKTFGLKNKKGNKQQTFIKQVEKQVKDGGNKCFKDQQKERDVQKKIKDDKKKALDEINDLFKPVQQIVAKGVDPKSVLCAFFKQGSCTKGTKCKFSHDVDVERKSEKRSYFEEDESAQPEGESIEDIIEKKHGMEKSRTGGTSIICRDFLNAVESGKYGWFWNCSSGEKCKYKHALPPGYMLKKDKKKLEKGENINLEDLIERERAALGPNTTKVTLETFLAWKKKKLKEKEEREQKDVDKRKKDFNSGKNTNISGKDMFTFKPDIAFDGQGMEEEGDEEFDFKNMENDIDEDDEEHKFQFKEIDFDDLMADYKDVDEDPRVTKAADSRFDKLRDEIRLSAAVEAKAAQSTENGAVAIDEDLFGGDDDDLDDLEDELDDLDIS